MKIVKQGVGVFRPKHKHHQQKQHVQSQRDAGSPRGWVNVVAEGGTEKGVEVPVEEGVVKPEGTALREGVEEKPKTDGEPKPEAETERQPKRKALLVGIQNYDKVERLRGPHQDVLDMRELLIGGPSFFPLLRLD